MLFVPWCVPAIPEQQHAPNYIHPEGSGYSIQFSSKTCTVLPANSNTHPDPCATLPLLQGEAAWPGHAHEQLLLLRPEPPLNRLVRPGRQRRQKHPRGAAAQLLNTARCHLGRRRPECDQGSGVWRTSACTGALHCILPAASVVMQLCQVGSGYRNIGLCLGFLQYGCCCCSCSKALSWLPVAHSRVDTGKLCMSAVCLTIHLAMNHTAGGLWTTAQQLL